MSNEKEKELVVSDDFTPTNINVGEIYTSSAAFAHVQRIAKVFASSDLVPAAYRGNLANCILGVELALRLNVPVMMLMQHTYPFQGKPAMEGKFVVGLLNMRGPYVGGVRYEYTGKGETRSCTAIGIREDGTRDTVTVDVPMAKAMGWWQRNQMWHHITDQMLSYRSAAWLARRHCPEIIFGLQTVEEVSDVVDVTPERELNAKITELKNSNS